MRYKMPVMPFRTCAFLHLYDYLLLNAWRSLERITDMSQYGVKWNCAIIAALSEFVLVPVRRK
jgi:hypothetical protein